jgi:hypothetical protein
MYKAKELESLFIEIISPRGKNIVLGGIYRHPCMDAEEFNSSQLEGLLEKLRKERNKNIMLLGDFNINLLKYESDNQVSDFVDKMFANFLQPLIISPTRVTIHSKTLIDNIFSNFISDDEIFAGNLTLSISDHFAQFCIINETQSNVSAPSKFLYLRNYKNLNEDKLNTDLSSVNWKELCLFNRNNVDLSLEKFTEKVNDIMNIHVPIKKIRVNHKSIKRKPWITNGLLKSINKKNKLYHKFCTAKNNERKDLIFTEYKAYKNIISSLILKSKDFYYKNYFYTNKKNTIKVWKGIKDIINFNSKAKNCGPSSIIKKNELITDEHEMAVEFNDYFTLIAGDIDKSIVNSRTNYMDYLDNSFAHKTFNLNPVTAEEVQDYIDTLKNQKSCGPNSIPTILLKISKSILSEPLANIINISFSSGVFPSSLKLAEVIPVFKKGDKTIVSNYRPISLLSNISKIIERIVRNRLYIFLESNDLIYDFQFGFRNGHSTNHALIMMLKKIQESIDQGHYACSVFIDLQKAFDTVNHKILLNKLPRYGVRGMSHKWLSSYLYERKQYTKIGNSNSSERIINYGVPQGSVLGPLLFLIYINDLCKCIHHCNSLLFADDTNLSIFGNSLKELNRKINFDLRLLTEWLRANRISLNTKKTEIIIFRSKFREITTNLNFRLSGQKLNLSKSVKYLGLILDENLTWQSQINILKMKLSRATGLLAKIRHLIGSFAIKSIYSAIFHSNLLYGCQLWGQKYESIAIKKLIRLQNKAIRIISFKTNEDPVNILYNNLQILPLDKQVFFLNIMFVYDSLSKNNPAIFHNFYTKSIDNHNHRTRAAASAQLAVPRISTASFGSNSLFYRSIINWNKFTKDNFPNKSPLDLERSKFVNFVKKIIFSKLLM